jgi:hypothetical protein
MFSDDWEGDAMLVKLKSALRSFINRFHRLEPASCIESRVRKALALNRRHEARSDGLELKLLETTLLVEWIAREVHPWERFGTAMSIQKLYTTQCLQDTQAAIQRLFAMIPEAEAIEVRVFSATSMTPILAGIVHRKDLKRAVYKSLGMNLKSLGISFRLSDWRLEPLPPMEEHAERSRAHS